MKSDLDLWRYGSMDVPLCRQQQNRLRHNLSSDLNSDQL